MSTVGYVHILWIIESEFSIGYRLDPRTLQLVFPLRKAIAPLAR